MEHVDKDPPGASFVYRLVRFIMKMVLSVFFQEIEVVGKENVPASGPVIFVGNHPNQFVDGMMMFTKSPRDVFLIIAASSIKKYPVEGFFATLQHAIPVYRREDSAFMIKENMALYYKEERWEIRLDKDSKAFSSRGVKRGDFLCLPFVETIHFNEHEYKEVTVTIIDLPNDTTAIVTVMKEAQCLIPILQEMAPLRFSNSKVLPKLDQRQAYSAIFKVLERGDCIGVFPEGGSSDWTSLRKLKIHKDLPVTIVPCGLNYISGHRFRSKTLIEFGTPLVISKVLVDRFISGDKAAVPLLTDQINSKLRDVTLNIPQVITDVLDANQFEAREIINTARRLYQPSAVQLPVKEYLELNRRFANSIAKTANEPKIIALLEEIQIYNRSLKKLYLTDRQISNSPPNWNSAVWDVFTLLKQLVLLLPFLLAIPGLALHVPVAIFTKSKALSVASASAARSEVKIEGRDVIASTKIAVGFVLIVLCNILYALITGLLFGWLWAPLAFFLLPIYSFFCIQYYDSAALTVRGMIPLFKFLVSKSYRKACTKLAARRKELSETVRETVKEFGPRFKYWEQRLVPDHLLTVEHEEDCTNRVPFSPLSQSYQTVESGDMFSGLADDLFGDEMEGGL